MANKKKAASTRKKKVASTRTSKRLDDIDRRLDRITKLYEDMEKQRQKEAKQRQKEAKQSQDRVDRQLEKTSIEVEKASRSIKNLRRHVGGQDNRWSRIVESLVAGSLSEILAASLQIKVNFASTRVKGTYRGNNWEIDVLAVNEGTVVPVEVKTTLKQDDIDYFIARILDRLANLIPRYKHDKIYGAIAFVKIEGNEDSVINYALSKGLIVIKAMKGTNYIVNPKKYTPRDFNPHS